MHQKKARGWLPAVPEDAAWASRPDGPVSTLQLLLLLPEIHSSVFLA